jgi:hypothetical protein
MAYGMGNESGRASIMSVNERERADQREGGTRHVQYARAR